MIPRGSDHISTMTREVTISMVREADVLREGSEWELLRSARGRLGRIDAVRVAGSAEELSDRLVGKPAVWVASVEVPLQPDTRIAHYFGIWGRSPLGREPEGAVTWRINAQREAGLALVPAAKTSQIIDFAAHGDATAILLPHGADRPPLTQDALVGAFDGEAQRFDWGELLVVCYEMDTTLVRFVRDEFGLEGQAFDRPERLEGCDP